MFASSTRVNIERQSFSSLLSFQTDEIDAVLNRLCRGIIHNVTCDQAQVKWKQETSSTQIWFLNRSLCIVGAALAVALVPQFGS